MVLRRAASDRRAPRRAPDHPRRPSTRQSRPRLASHSTPPHLPLELSQPKPRMTLRPVRTRRRVPTRPWRVGKPRARALARRPQAHNGEPRGFGRKTGLRSEAPACFPHRRQRCLRFRQRPGAQINACRLGRDRDLLASRRVRPWRVFCAGLTRAVSCTIPPIRTFSALPSRSSTISSSAASARFASVLLSSARSATALASWARVAPRETPPSGHTVARYGPPALAFGYGAGGEQHRRYESRLVFSLAHRRRQYPPVDRHSSHRRIAGQA